ncbi:Flagellar M-ring protein FliF [Planococcus halocryophilus Or1]|nr:Flagellar M-ring protein FliF [Planococcus halocryophilus Or1]
MNRINRQIEMSPYVIDDITINVGVEPPVPENPASLTQENIADISNLLKNAVSTSLSMNEVTATEMELEDRISVFATEFQGRPVIEDEEPEITFLTGIPNSLLVVICAAIVLLLIIVIAVILLRRNKKKKF